MAETLESRAGAPTPLGHTGLIVDGRFRLVERIGAGGFGEVWKAEQLADGSVVQTVALKLMPAPRSAADDAGEKGASPRSHAAELRPDAWLDEVRNVVKIKSDAIPQIHYVGTTRDGRLRYIAMKLLHGRTLDDRLKQGPIYWRRALAIAREVVRALCDCHRHTITHGDLKPNNVFLEKKDGRVFVLDFGLARQDNAPSAPRASQPQARELDDQATAEVSEAEMPAGDSCEVPRRLVGSPGYIAPELFAGHPLTPAADVYALGVMLYRMLSGRLPYRLPESVRPASVSGTHAAASSYLVALNTATARGERVPLAEARPDVPRGVAALVEDMLCTDPAGRPTAELKSVVERAFFAPHGAPEAPYVGLESLGTAHFGHIFGRDSDVEAIMKLLRRRHCAVLCGPSGCGKSSLAMAGVAARVDEEMLDDLDGWRSVVLRPSQPDIGRALNELLKRPEQASTGTLVIVDQLEEVLALPEGPRAELCAKLATVAAGLPLLRLLCTVRDDFMGQVAAIPELQRFPEQNMYTVRGIDPSAAAEIVKQPAAIAGYALEEIEEVVKEARELLTRDPGGLPLLQFGLQLWWEQRDQDEKRMKREVWERIGGIDGALSTGADNLYDELNPHQKERTRSLMVELFDADGTRVQVPEASVAIDDESRDVLTRLLEARLIRKVRQPEVEGGDRIEVVHEALGRCWLPLRSWLAETQGERLAIQELNDTAKLWVRTGEPPDLLGKGARLSARTLHSALPEESVRFLAASRRARQRKRGLKNAGIALAAAVIVFPAASWWSVQRSERRLKYLREQSAIAQDHSAAAMAEARKAEAKAKRAYNAQQKAQSKLDAARRAAESERQKLEETRKLKEQIEASLAKETRAKEKAARNEKKAKERVDEEKQLAARAADKAAEALEKRKAAEREAKAALKKYEQLARSDELPDY